MSSINAPQTIAPGRVLADFVPGERARDAILISLFALAIGASAQVAVPLPFTPVPITGQTFAVLLGAAALGAGRATIGTALYAGLGLIGLPWFAAASGASLGYIFGFIAAAAVVGKLARSGNDRTFARTFALMVLGNLVIYAFGVPVLATVLGVGLGKAISLGAVPFFVGDLLKIALAVGVLPATWRLVARRDDV